MLEINNLSVPKILNNINLELKEGELVFIIGPNGAGKTTLLRAIGQHIEYNGRINLMNKGIRTYKDQERARLIASLKQQKEANFPYKVSALVEFGRYSFEEKVDITYALELMELTSLKDEVITNLSGGEIQRAYLAQLIVQDSNIFLLDEPTNHLDLKYQEKLFNYLKEQVEKPNRACLIVTHNLSLAYEFSDRVYLLKEGEVFKSGTSKEVMTEEILEKAYGMNVYNWQKRLSRNWM